MLYIFATIGLGASAAALILLSWVIIDAIREYIHGLKQEKRWKTRFNKTPTAKCYCIDCCHFEKDTHRCTQGNNNHCYDAFFCEDAEPHRTKF